MKNKTLKDNLVNASREKGFSFSKLEEKAGLHKHYISHLINNERVPRIDSIVRLADILDISLDELVGRSKTHFPSKFKKIVENGELFEEIISFLNEHLQLNNPTGYNLETVFNYIDACYNYSLEQNNGIFEKSFAEYLYKRTFS